MRRASLGTIFLTIFLDLLGFGLVVPYLPGVAREHGASDLTAALLGAAYASMQLFFVPFWGHLSDRTGRRPILVWSVAASVVGSLILGSATSLWMLFLARIWNGVATANIAVAQAYIADVTRPEERAHGMGVIGAGIGLGFVFGPLIGGVLEALRESLALPMRPGALPAFVAAALSLANLALALRFLPESLPPERRTAALSLSHPSASVRERLLRRGIGAALDPTRLRAALRLPGVALALALNFVLVTSFASMEQTFRLFTLDEFGMSVKSTGYVLGLVGFVLVVVQGGFMRPLARVVSERTLVRAGLVFEAVGFAALAAAPAARSVPLVYASMAVIGFGSALTNPGLSAYVSKCGDAQNQGVALGVLQSVGALARVCGPALGGVLYQEVGHAVPYAVAAGGIAVAGAMALGLRPVAAPSAVVSAS